MSVICCKCGSTNVSCEAMINPNTKAFINYTDESFDYGWCENCKTGQPLTDTEEIKLNIDKAVNNYQLTFKKSPLYASCQIVFSDSDDAPEDVVIKLSSDIGDNDDEIFFYCNGIDDLKSLTELSANDFIIQGFGYFFD